MLKPIGMMYVSCTVLEMPLWRWLQWTNFVPLGLVTWQTHKTIDCIGVTRMTQGLVVWIQKHIFGRSGCSMCCNLMLVVFFRTAFESTIRELNNWLCFWHFYVRQWGAFMLHVRHLDFHLLFVYSFLWCQYLIFLHLKKLAKV
jgi:hypothetical protein